MSERPIAVLGECVADAFVTSPDAAPEGALGLEVFPGGGPANTAVALARLGVPTRFLGRLSQDVFGRLFRAHLDASGVDLSRAVKAAEPSTLGVADLAEDGSADFSFHAQGTADWQWRDAELAAASAGPVACLHTGSLALVREPGGAAVERLLGDVRERATVSVDPNVRPLLVDPVVYREALPRWCAATDILRLSDDDLAHLRPGAGPEEAADAFHADGAGLVVVTLGAGGVLASLRGRRVRVATPRTEVVDTVGAGDSFMAGFLHALYRAGELGGRLDGLTVERVEEALTFGTRVAAAVVAVRGANPPWAADLGLPATRG
ncbi:carbohydrate kinase [Streptomyces sp. NBC_01795]|uniref:carbohydrate kinase family protein n=1 Tax=unclassified Streptomyces TaxID=2593676 RepID=UPI002DDAF56E|nr:MULTISPECIES: carbohydrate kinase [unclassified Streptomyces]WSA91714.1 carbohydrate kinase [Streptomyces sp. NBC_01795]WSB76086.1 carbohydrate kinase [Streptomyces sp. NBC_01775]WSS15640.1 carbohydrate kinase [Streptomyces sp. NBC_01186]